MSCKDSCDESHVEIKLSDDWRPTGFRICCKQPTEIFTSTSNEMIVIFRAMGGAAGAGFRAKVWSG
jgi:hypothetical protein